MLCEPTATANRELRETLARSTVCHSNWDKIINEASGGTNGAPGVAGAERRVSEVL